MSKLQKTILILSILFAFSSLHAERAKEQVYENGFSVTISSSFPIEIDYFLGKNNTWKVFFGVSPYAEVKNQGGLAHQDTHQTLIGSGMIYYLPLARYLTRNKLFFPTIAYWKQRFGQANFNAKIKSSWFTGWATGLEYRFTPNFYLGMGIPAVAYSQTRYQTPNTSTFITDTTETSWKFFSDASVYITFKF